MSHKHLSNSHKHLGTLLLSMQQFPIGFLNLRGGEHPLKMWREVGAQKQWWHKKTSLLKEDPRLTYKDIEGALQICSPSVSTILHQHLRLKKISFWWVLHHLSERQIYRVEWCREMLEKFNKGDSCWVSDIVTDDKTWFYQYDPKTKVHSSVWVFADEQPPINDKRPGNVGKKMVPIFFSTSGHLETCARGSEDSYR